MINWHSYNSKRIPIRDINLEDNYFKLSRNNITELTNSIASFGALAAPVLLYKESKYSIVFGHNRIKALRELQNEYTDSIVPEDISSGLFLEYAMLKNFRNEIGPIGKVKLLLIMRNYFNFNNERLFALARDINVPKEFIHKTGILESISAFPDDLKDYIDIRNIGYKTIKNILHLPHDGISLAAQWIKNIEPRVNIFKSLIDFSVDIYKRDKTLNALENIVLDSIQDKRKKENFLYNQIKKIRFPQYIELREKAEKILENLKKNGIEVDFPEYFEGDEICIKYRIRKKEGVDLFRKRINEVDMTALERLMELL